MSVPLEIQFYVTDILLFSILRAFDDLPNFLLNGTALEPWENAHNHTHPLPISGILSLLLVSKKIHTHISSSLLFKLIRIRSEYLQPRSIHLARYNTPGAVIGLKMWERSRASYAVKADMPSLHNPQMAPVATERFYILPQINENMDVEFYTIQSFQYGTYLKMDPRIGETDFYVGFEDTVGQYEKLAIDFFDTGEIMIKNSEVPLTFLAMNRFGVQRYDEISFQKAQSENFEGQSVKFAIFPPLPPHPRDIFLHPEIYNRPQPKFPPCCSTTQSEVRKAPKSEYARPRNPESSTREGKKSKFRCNTKPKKNFMCCSIL